ncbi:MAG: 4Fe-4S cluster-binding domain-containing protein, partial [Schwartzia sp.]|nr:4Fe-4S cluster-binding domain-containing protein [Schwartzia sp. (in: firmicutes)]
SYTGYTYEKLCSSDDPAVHALLDELDVLVDGPFVLSQKDLTLEFRGSKNQRVIDMNATRKEGRVVLKYND